VITVNQAIQHERAVIGAILTRPSLEAQLLNLDAEDFTDALMREAFQACKDARAAGKDITRGLVLVELSKRGTLRRESIENVLIECEELGAIGITAPGDHVRAVRDRAFLARLKRRLSVIEDATEAEAVALEEIGRRSDERGVGPVPLGPVLADVAKRQHEIAGGAVPDGFTTGIDALDEHCLIRPGDFHTVIARTGEGKSWYLQQLVRANVRNPGRPVRALLFSLEMEREAFAKRHFAMESNLNGLNARSIGTRFLGPAHREHLDQIAKECRAVAIDIDDQSDIGVDEIIARAKHWKRRHCVQDGIVGVDFAQIVNRERGRDESNADALQRVSYSLRRLAQSERLAVIATAQINREGEKDSSPRLEHIEGGGGPARASALVIGLHLSDRSDRGNERAIEVHVLKNRHGQSGKVLRGTVDFSNGRFAF
jgi:replicative DNA helicase